MADTYTSNLQLLHLRDNQDGAAAVFNAAANKLDAFLGYVVILDSAPPVAPPGNPAEGAVYTVPASATGDWSTFTAGNLAIYSSGWIEIVPWDGLRAFDLRNLKEQVRHGGVWTDLQSTAIADLTDNTGGTPASSLVDVSLGFDETTDNVGINANFASLNAKVDAILLAMRRYMHIAPASTITKVSNQTVSVAETNVDVLTT